MKRFADAHALIPPFGMISATASRVLNPLCFASKISSAIAVVSEFGFEFPRGIPIALEEEAKLTPVTRRRVEKIGEHCLREWRNRFAAAKQPRDFLRKLGGVRRRFAP